MDLAITEQRISLALFCRNPHDGREAMNLKRRILYILVVIVTVLAVDYFFIHNVFPAKRERFFKDLNQNVSSSLEEHPPGMGKLGKAMQAHENNSDGDFKTTSEACLGKAWNSYETFPQDLKKAYKIQSQVTDIENFHLKLPNGEERRIHVVSDGRNHKTVRLFKLDSEGQPTPVPLSADLRSQPMDRLIENLKSQGDVFFQQSKERWLLGNGSTLIVTFENGKAYEFQLFGGDKTLSCLKNSCQCF